ncbi:MAG: DUF6356 family protein [Gammaproteobacteria bacterium]|nr:DUF6356 family protein [Gammaproteobacteria bacterium]
MFLASKFTAHPATVGETYGQHFISSMGFSLALIRAAFCCGVHAILPFAFEKSGSACIAELYDRMVSNRSRLEGGQALDTETA